MFSIKKLSDEELEEYLQNFEETKELNGKKIFVQDIESVKKKLEGYLHQINAIVNCINNEEYEVAYSKCHEIALKLSKESTYLNKLPFIYGEKNGMGKLKKEIVEKKDVKFIYEKESLRILLPELLPHKPQYDVSSGEIRYYYNIDVFRSSYYEVFAKEFMTGKYNMMEKKVLIIYKHHYKNLYNAPDPDNLDTKPMTDIITTFLLVDDSFPYCSQYHTAVEDNYEYTEIIIRRDF